MQGRRFKEALARENPLQIAGVINACAALLAKQANFQALYLSGAGVANAAFGLPDLGLTSITDVSTEIRRITDCLDLPLLVDGDTGFGNCLTIQRMIKEFINAGAAAVHIEDQVWPKRCGHRTGKTLVTKQQMVDRIKAALDARHDSDFVVMIRTDALGLESSEATIDRVKSYVEAGADMIFVEAAKELNDYQTIAKVVAVPVLANITEFGQTPLFSLSELKSVGVRLVLYPLTAFRAMNHAALQAYQTLRQTGSQASLIPSLQTREALYGLLDYYRFESQLEEEFKDRI